MMLEYIAVSGKKLDKLIDELHKEYGDSHYIRKDVKLKRPVVPSELYSRIGKNYKKVLGSNIYCWPLVV